jgi:hypothetical protein
MIQLITVFLVTVLALFSGILESKKETKVFSPMPLYRKFLFSISLRRAFSFLFFNLAFIN